VPTGDIVINDDFSTGQPNFREFFYGMVSQSGESANFDGNGEYVRINPGGGPVLSRSAVPGAVSPNQYLYANMIVPLAGTQPALSAPPPIRGDVPCHTNDVPDLNGPAAAVGPPSPEVAP
jgi:hypothetical protein